MLTLNRKHSRLTVLYSFFAGIVVKEQLIHLHRELNTGNHLNLGKENKAFWMKVALHVTYFSF